MSQEQPTTPPTKDAPCAKDPAPQPPAPTDSCKPIVIGKDPPCYQEPPTCVSCCECPPVPASQPTCLDELIKGEADAINKGEQAKKFKADLEALLAKVKAAALDYTADSYADLLKRWKQEDEAIVCLVNSIRCALPCWWCVIECELCPLVNDIVRMESKLSGDFKTCTSGAKTNTTTTPPAATTPAAAAPTSTTQATTCPPGTPTSDCWNSLYDLRNWWDSERRRRQALYSHVTGIMHAWESPFKAIDGALKANAEILKSASTTLGVDQKRDAPRLLFDVFFRLIPQHMAIAPPKDVSPTGIDRKYIDLCCCDSSPVLHECCGVTIRLPTVRDRLIGQLPYLITPDKYAPLVCCLATNVYWPAKQSAVEADSRYAERDTEIKALEKAIPAQLASLAADAKLRLSKTIDCDSYKPKAGADGSKDPCDCGSVAPPSTATGDCGQPKDQPNPTTQTQTPTPVSAS